MSLRCCSSSGEMVGCVTATPVDAGRLPGLLPEKVVEALRRRLGRGGHQPVADDDDRLILLEGAQHLVEGHDSEVGHGILALSMATRLGAHARELSRVVHPLG